MRVVESICCDVSKIFGCSFCGGRSSAPLCRPKWKPSEKEFCRCRAHVLEHAVGKRRLRSLHFGLWTRLVSDIVLTWEILEFQAKLSSQNQTAFPVVADSHSHWSYGDTEEEVPHLNPEPAPSYMLAKLFELRKHSINMHWDPEQTATAGLLAK